jgi:hypothetical protein
MLLDKINPQGGELRWLTGKRYALSEGQHYLAMYSQDGPHSLEIRRVEVLPHHALPIPAAH